MKYEEAGCIELNVVCGYVKHVSLFISLSVVSAYTQSYALLSNSTILHIT